MKISVVGCGALGSFYGARLCASGTDVHFLLRSDYETVREQGVRIQSIDGDCLVHPHCAKDPSEIGPSDLVLIGLKTTANEEFGRLIPPLIGANTAVLTLQNGLGNEELLAALLGHERILGGLCFVCLNRIAPGVVLHTAHGDVLLGEFERPPGPRTEQIAELFRNAGLRCTVAPNLEKAHWEKLVWNIPFNGLGVAGSAGFEAVIRGSLGEHAILGPTLATDQLLGDAAWERLVRELMEEVIAIAGGIGFSIPASVIADRIARTREMSAYKASTLIDFERGQPLELESLFFEPLRRAEAARVPTPRLRALCQVLASVESQRRNREKV